MVDLDKFDPTDANAAMEAAAQAVICAIDVLRLIAERCD